MKKLLFSLLILALFVVACSGAAEEGTTPSAGSPTAPGQEAEGEEAVLTVMTHDSFDISAEIITAFEEEHNARIELLPAGDTGTALNQAILAAGDPLADVFYGVDNTFFGRALDAGIFEPYRSPLLAQIPDRFQLDESNRLLPVDYGDVCLNYDVQWFADRGVEPPAGLEELTEAAYENLLVVENPATSSPGLAFMLATIDHFGVEGDYTWLDYWSELRENGVLVTNDWNNAYYGHFTVASDGDRPLVVSYASSPPAEVMFADPPVDEAPSASVTGDGSCFRQIEFVGILQGTEQRDLAEAWIDYMLSQPFQEDIPAHMFVFPVNENAELPPVFVEYAAIPQQPATVDPAAIDANREEWIEAWTETVLR